MAIDELDSAKNFPDRGEVTVLWEEVERMASNTGRRTNEALRIVLKEKGVPMIGLWPAFHPDFKITISGAGTVEKFSWVRRALLPENATV
jgi:hypothetical protein